MTIATKIRSLIPAALLICFSFSWSGNISAQANYRLNPNCIDYDLNYLQNTIGLQTIFPAKNACIEYVNKLPAVLQSKGYVTASVDSVFFDSTSATIVLFLGRKYKWAQLTASGDNKDVLEAGRWDEKNFTGKPMNFTQVKSLQEGLLNHLEKNGYPFGKIFLDSLVLDGDSVAAILKIEKGPIYKIDSIRVFGTAKVANNFLQHYLDIRNGSIYNKEKLLRISKKILELPYVQEEQASDLSLLGTGSVLNLYLKQKRSSQVNVLIGFLPDNDPLAAKKILITGEANINLRNAFGNGEAIGLNWQQLQLKSPRLNIFYQHPYIFNSPVGLDFSFDMYRKDSNYLNINMNFGARYVVSESASGKLFLQNFQTIISLGGINTANVIATHRLPSTADISALAVGIDYEKNKTNYRYNPRSGYEYRIIASTGTKKVKKNNEILDLKDPNNPSFNFDALYDTVKLKSYQLRLIGSAAKYFPFGKQGTIKTAFNGGVFQSDNIFKNELFQIGGYKLLRGFDEESQYVSRYAIATLEYRYLIGLNSYFFVFSDGGWASNKSNLTRINHTYLGFGLGMAFETKAGIFNLAWAAGKRDDTPFDLKQSKIHIGFINYF